MTDLNAYGPGSNRRFKITEKGIADNKSFRRKLNRWLDGTVARFPWDPEHNATLGAFARRQGESLTVYEVMNEAEVLEINVVESMSKFLKEGLIEEVSPRSESEPGLSSSRSFPKTYGDWVNLAEDIKKADPDNVWLHSVINVDLQHISDGDEKAEASKRALGDLADKYRIK